MRKKKLLSCVLAVCMALTPAGAYGAEFSDGTDLELFLEEMPETEEGSEIEEMEEIFLDEEVPELELAAEASELEDVEVFSAGEDASGSPGIVETDTDIIITAVEGGRYNVVRTDKKVLVDVSDGETCAVTICDLDIFEDCAFEIKGSGTVYLTLEGENKLWSYGPCAGLQLSDGANLIIEGNGKLTAHGGDYGAGIGTGQNGGAGNIRIKSGTIKAMGGQPGAGIGNGTTKEAGQINRIGNIVIEGGNIIAEGGASSAGIGGGAGERGENYVGNIIITGGVVKAEGKSGGFEAVGIGSARTSYVYGTCYVGNIVIDGGTVTAIGGDRGGVGICISNNNTSSTFSASGNAFIDADSFSNGLLSSENVSDCVIFNGPDGTVYGTNVVLETNAEILLGKKLIIPTGTTLEIADGVTFVNNGIIAGDGNLIVNGSFKDNGVTDPSVKVTMSAQEAPDVSKEIIINYSDETIEYYNWWNLEVNSAEDFGPDTVVPHKGNLSIRMGQTIYVRYKAQGNAPASKIAKLSIPTRPAAPTGLSAKNEEFAGDNEGVISGLDGDKAYQYKKSTDEDWTEMESGKTEINGLIPGTYEVRFAATDSAFASESVTLELAKGTERTYTLEVTVPEFANVTYGYARPQAGNITVKNTGNSAVTIKGLYLIGDSTSYFEFDSKFNVVILPNEIETYPIRPIERLEERSYVTQLRLDYSEYDEDKEEQLVTKEFPITFTVNKIPLHESDFGFKEPEYLQYDGLPKSATVTKNEEITNAGDVTVVYVKDGVDLITQPTDAGTYMVKINVLDSTNYETTRDLTDTSWTFTIAQATPIITLADKTATYNKNAIEIDSASVIGEMYGGEPTGDVTYTYYTDEACTEHSTGYNLLT